MPAQFEGRTIDGRPVYIRYRGGQLSVRCGDVGHAGNIYDVEPLLDASIGPPFDGYIDLEQACELTGITLKGKPFEHSPTSGPRDWTGHTTYWERHVKTTRQGAQVFVEALAGWLGMPTLLEGEWTGLDRGQQPSSRFVRRADLNACKSYVILCFNPIDDNYGSLLEDKRPAWPKIKACFELTVRLQFGFREIKSNPGFPAFFREKRPDIQFLTGVDGSISTEFPSDDKERRSTIKRIVDVADQKFSNVLKKIDLETGQATPLDWFWYSIDLVDLCRSDPNLFLAFGQNENAKLPATDWGAREYFVIRPKLS